MNFFLYLKACGEEIVWEIFSLFIYFKKCLFIFEREREREHDQGRGGKRETQNLKQDPVSELSAQSPTQGSNS